MSSVKDLPGQMMISGINDEKERMEGNDRIEVNNLRLVWNHEEWCVDQSQDVFGVGEILHLVLDLKIFQSHFQPILNVSTAHPMDEVQILSFWC